MRDVIRVMQHQPQIAQECLRCFLFANICLFHNQPNLHQIADNKLSEVPLSVQPMPQNATSLTAKSGTASKPVNHQELSVEHKKNPRPILSSLTSRILVPIIFIIASLFL